MTPKLTPKPRRTTWRRTVEELHVIIEVADAERTRLLTERPDIDDVLTVDEVMAKLHIGRTRFQELVMSGALPSFKPGRERLVRASDLRKYIESLVGTLVAACWLFVLMVEIGLDTL